MSLAFRHHSAQASRGGQVAAGKQAGKIMAKKSGKGPRVMIKMASTESPYRFTTTKNKRNHPQRLQLKRYDPVVRRHVLFKEDK